MTSSLEEESWTRWLGDTEQEDDFWGLINKSAINVDDDVAAMLVEENNTQSSNYATSSSNLSNSSSPYCSSYILSFDDNSSVSILPEQILSKVESALKPKGTSKKSESVSTRPTRYAQDHLVAERMRREKISQQFIALSALIPGLTKIDKASVLGDAIKYVKQLKDQVKVLEEESMSRNGVQYVVLVSNYGEPSRTNKMSLLPQVEARVSEKNVLIRIHCDKQKAELVSILSEIEKLHLTVTNTSAMLFGSSVMDITIIAEKEDEFSMNVKELARSLRVGLLQFMLGTSEGA